MKPRWGRSEVRQKTVTKVYLHEGAGIIKRWEADGVGGGLRLFTILADQC